MTYVLVLLFGVGLCYVVLRPKLRATERLNEDIDAQNRELLNQKQEIALSLQSLVDKKQSQQEQINSLNAQRDRMERSLEKDVKLFDLAKKECKDSYLTILQDFAAQTQTMIGELQVLDHDLRDRKEKQQSYNEQLKRQQLDQEAKKFYQLELENEDLEDVDILYQMSKNLNNKEVLYKLIWKTYYEKTTNALISRIVTDKSGIYKITSNATGQVYIGQSVDLANRIKTHIKTGLGIGKTNNKLYSALWKEKVHNFTYEIIEYCEKEDLNQKEKFWIDFYESQDLGLNGQSGNGVNNV